MPRVVHFEVHAGDPARAIAFYEDIFGWTFREHEGPEEYWSIITGPPDEPGIDGGLVPRAGPEPEHSTTEYVCTVQVGSVDECAAAVLARGGRVLTPRFVITGVGWMAVCADTEGNRFSIIEKNREAR